jgi:hypothetical protein
MDKLGPEETRAFWRETIAEAVAQRNNELLGALIRKPPVCQESRDHLADVIEGLLSKQISFPNRKPKQDLEEKQCALAARVREIQKEKEWQLRSVVDFVAKETQCSASTVWAAWGKHGPPIIAGEILRERYGLDPIHDMFVRKGRGVEFGKATDEEMNLLIKLCNESLEIQKGLRRRRGRSK